MAETQEIMNPYKQPLIDITPTKNIFPDHDDELVIIDIPEELEPDLETTCWIYMVPIKLRQVNEAAYTPQLVSIGPFHHGKPKYKSMEGHKVKYQQQFWKRGFCKHIVENNVDVVEAFMKKEGRIERILRCYAATFELAEKDHVHHWANVILRDACFVFELFLRNYERKNKETNDYILRSPLLQKCISMDLMLLENQIPFFVFTELYDFILDAHPINLHNAIPHHLSKQQNGSTRRDFLLNVAIDFFRDYRLMGKPGDEQSSRQTQQIHRTTDSDLRAPLLFSPAGGRGGGPSFESEQVSQEEELKHMERYKEIKHFTDLIRKFLCHEENYKQTSKLNSCLYSAKKLDRAGVKFKFDTDTDAYLADIAWEQKKFRSLEVKVPKFTVQDDTECVMRNVMALEQCLYPKKPYICNYIALLDQLIDTAEDVELLIEKEIALNLLGSNDAVAKLVNKLGEQIVIQSSCYFELCEELNGNYNKWWSVSKETFKRVYFKDLWTGSSTVVGFFVTLFSVVSVISTIESLISG